MVIGRLRNNAASNTTGSPIITRNVREEKVGVKLQVRKWTEDDSGSLANSGLDGFGPFSHVVPLRLLCRLSFGDAVSPNAVESTTHVCNGVQATSVNLHDLYLSIPLTHHMIAGGCLTTFVSGIVFLETSRISADSAGLGGLSSSDAGSREIFHRSRLFFLVAEQAPEFPVTQTAEPFDSGRVRTGTRGKAFCACISYSNLDGNALSCSFQGWRLPLQIQIRSNSKQEPSEKYR
jgi:hypothetical protein